MLFNRSILMLKIKKVRKRLWTQTCTQLQHKPQHGRTRIEAIIFLEKILLLALLDVEKSEKKRRQICYKLNMNHNWSAMRRQL